MSRWCDRSIHDARLSVETNGREGRWIVRNSRCGNHLGQRSCTSAFKGRTYGRKRSDQNRLHDLAGRAPSTYGFTFRCEFSTLHKQPEAGRAGLKRISSTAICSRKRLNGSAGGYGTAAPKALWI